MEKFPWETTSKIELPFNVQHISQELNFNIPLASNEIPPDFIEAMYKNDLNIIKIHEAIRAIFAYKLVSVSFLKKEKEKLNIEMETLKLSFIEIREKQNRIISIDCEIADIKSGKLWNEYVIVSKPILEAYLPLCSNETKGVINISIYKEKEEDEEIVNKRHKIITNYLELAKNYIKLNISIETPNISICPVCKANITEIEDEDERGIYICDCGIERVSMSQSSKYQNLKNDSSSKSIYDDLGTFIKRLNAFECKQDYEIPDKLFELLDEYFISLGKLSCEKIRNMALLPNGKKTGTSIKLLETGLYSTLNSEYYKDMEYISHKLWGWKVHNLDNYRERIINDYKKTQESYKNIKREESLDGVKKRHSSLNINMRLFWHLKAVDYPDIDYEDFKTVTSRESLEYHNKTMKRMCLEANIKFIDVI